jgi:hypothetical protein
MKIIWGLMAFFTYFLTLTSLELVFVGVEKMIKRSASNLET